MANVTMRKIVGKAKVEGTLAGVHTGTKALAELLTDHREATKIAEKAPGVVPMPAGLHHDVTIA